MPRPQSHQLALFSLKALNNRAHDVVTHPCNSHLASTLPDGEPALDVGFNIRSKSCDTLATLGRGDTDIFVEGSSIAKIQCSFEIDLDSRVIMLYDRSNGLTTQVSGDNAMPFEHGRRRRVVVQKGLNTIIGMGGVGCDLVQFELKWHPNYTQKIENVKSQDLPWTQDENPRLARTVDTAPTVLPSQRVTRIHTPGDQKLRMRYEKVGPPLGSGEFGIVHKCIDVDSGKFMAVKVLKRPPETSEKYHTLKREVETLSNINHPHIIDYITSQGWDEQDVLIFMGLGEGNLGSLVEGNGGLFVADTVFRHMLEALDHLAYNGIVHRDMKPENILYELLPSGQYHFRLGDFGLCNRVIDATTFAGSLLYMAPEMWKGVQTSKLDIYSLFVTMLWVLDIERFRQKDVENEFKSIGDAQEAVVHAAANADTVSRIREMAVVDPEERASAAQMLIKCFNGEGLSTPRNQVPALPISPSPASATARAAAPAPHALTTRNTQTKPRGLRKNANVFAAAAQYRIEKGLDPLQARPFRRLLGPKSHAKS